MTGPVTICYPFAGGIVGGSHISAVQLIQRLDRRRFDPLVVVHHPEGQVGALLRDEGISFEAAPTRWHFGRAPGVWQARGPVDLARAAAGQWALARFLRQRKVDIVHSNEGAMHVTWALPARVGGSKLLWHHRSSPEARGLRHLAPLLADRVVAVSRFALSEFEGGRHGVPTSVVYSPFDTNLDVDRAAARGRLLAELGVPADTVVIGYFGNFVGRKRPVLFVDVIAELAAQLPGLPVVGAMFGDTIEPMLEDAVRRRASGRGVADRVRLMGFRYPGAEWLAACDVLAVTAVGEPFGRTLIEAMLLGTAVVAVNDGGNCEAIDHLRTGLLASVDNASAIADKIAMLLTDPDRRRRIVETARSHARQRFGQDQHCADIEAIYAGLLPPPGQRRQAVLHPA